MTFPAGKPALTSSSQKVLEGQGAPAKDGDVLAAKVTVYNWDGKENKSPGSDYDQGKSEFVTVNPQLPKALHDALVGAKPGGRVLAVIAKDNLSPDQVTQAKQQGTDFTTSSQVLVVDVVSAAAKAAQGAATDPGVAGVKLDNPGGDKAPTLTTKTDAKAPKGLVVKTVIKGSGPAVKADQTILAHYTGKIWGTDKQFDSSWERGEPATFALNQVVKGWSQGLTGVPVGSRVLITIPPDLGYGKEGNAQGGIKGTDTLVFVVDVLAAA
ncbi:FKBP-type peptidyl-prolyl cis-trans isomerase [Planotetraspora sp. GP83]|uniref:FKBP-type peptidyl-prolyl cis-trans isomerase n=1 Tax=Planotetraspora sp. GP83 TaxID=3156264 RepID=UPI0035110A34